MTAQTAILVSLALWVLALWWDRTRQSSKKAPEFWWAAVAFGTGGLGTLVTFTFLGITSDGVLLIRTLPLIALTAVLVLQSLLARPVIPPAGAAMIVFFAVILTHVLLGSSIPALPLYSLLLFLPMLIVPKAGRDLSALRSGATVGITITLLVVAVLVLLNPDQMIGPCRSDKCSLWGVALGSVGAGNALGLFIAASCALTLLTSRHVVTFIAIAVAGYVLVDLTSSRSAANGLIIGVLAALAYKVTTASGRLWVSRLAFLVVAVLVACFPYLGWSGFDLTGRALLWDAAAGLFEKSPLFGYGATYWLTDVSVPIIVANYSSHSFVPEMLVSAGAIGLAAVAIAIILAVFRNRDFTAAAYTTTCMTIVLGLSLTEVPSAPGRVYLIPALLVFAFMTADARTAAPAPVRAASEVHAARTVARHRVR